MASEHKLKECFFRTLWRRSSKNILCGRDI